MKEDAAILIVDDNDDNRYTLKRRLKRMGLKNIVEAENGLEAMKQVELQDFDMILLDIMMPIMDGYEVLKRLRAESRFIHMPIIMISALSDVEDVVKAIDLGADDYLLKPFNPVLLRAKVESSLLKKRLVEVEKNFYRDYDKSTQLAKPDLFIGTLDGEMRSNPDTTFTAYYFKFPTFQQLSQSTGHQGAEKHIKHCVDALKAIFVGDHYFFGRLADDAIAVYSIAKKCRFFTEQLNIEKEVIAPLDEAISISEETIRGVGQIHLGICLTTPKLHNGGQLIANSLFACETAIKEDKKVAYYDKAIHERTLEKFKLEPKLKQALNEKELVMYYQPIVLGATGEIKTFEALIRWPTANGMISPGEFIPLAEEIGLILDLDDYVMKAVCEQIGKWIKLKPSLKFSVGINISARHWADAKLSEKIINLLTLNDIPGNYLKLEMTESALVDDIASVRTNFDLLQSHGVQIALDDFGTGYASLSYLLDFPFDVLKIDRVFIVDIETDQQKQKLLPAILLISKSLNMESIIEGVETKEQVDMVNQCNGDLIQGFYFYKPSPVVDIDQLDFFK
jgi:EAL domain-containing protein (putative c-di-GMP-specific phosphodiesterase class I)/FixJ family two-component response regulator